MCLGGCDPTDLTSSRPPPTLCHSGPDLTMHYVLPLPVSSTTSCLQMVHSTHFPSPYSPPWASSPPIGPPPSSCCLLGSPPLFLGLLPSPTLVLDLLLSSWAFFLLFFFDLLLSSWASSPPLVSSWASSLLPLSSWALGSYRLFSSWTSFSSLLGLASPLLFLLFLLSSRASVSSSGTSPRAP